MTMAEKELKLLFGVMVNLFEKDFEKESEKKQGQKTVLLFCVVF